MLIFDYLIIIFYLSPSLILEKNIPRDFLLLLLSCTYIVFEESATKRLKATYLVRNWTKEKHIVKCNPHYLLEKLAAAEFAFTCASQNVTYADDEQDPRGGRGPRQRILPESPVSFALGQNL